jgi:hypothetical protein
MRRIEQYESLNTMKTHIVEMPLDIWQFDIQKQSPLNTVEE